MKNRFPNSTLLRLFVAITPDAVALENIHGTIKAWGDESWAGTIRWLPKNTIHLTLRFFGDTRPDQCESLSSSLEDIAGRLPPFVMDVGPPLFLPNPAKTRVVALSIDRCDLLETLAVTIENTARRLGFEPERRPFKAHMTVGRCRNLDLRAHTALHWCHDIRIKVTHIDLVKSTLSPQGSIYNSLGTFELKLNSPY